MIDWAPRGHTPETPDPSLGKNTSEGLGCWDQLPLPSRVWAGGAGRGHEGILETQRLRLGAVRMDLGGGF